jgi:putative oxidoreductase
MHMGLPTFLSPIVTAIELLGGAALILGIGTRIAAAAIALDMLGAILAVHLKNGFFLPTGFEYALTMLTANVALILTGPGNASLDGLRGRKA